MPLKNVRPPRIRWALGWTLVGLISWIPTDPSQAQVSDLLNWTVTDPGTSAPNRGADSGSVVFEGRALFLIAVPITDTEGTSPLPSPLHQRIASVETALNRVAASDFDPDTVQVVATLDANSRLPIITANGQYILTVTTLDAQLQGQSPSAWAGSLTTIIRDALIGSKQERRPEFLTQQGLIASGILVGLMLSSWGIGRWRRHLQQRYEAVKAANLLEKVVAASSGSELEYPTHRQQRLLQRLGIQVSLEVWQRLLRLSRVMLWGSGLSIGLGLFPYTRWLQYQILGVIQGPLLGLASVVLVTYLLMRISSVAITHFFTVLAKDSWLPQQMSLRLHKRLTTFSGVARGVVDIVLISIGGILCLSVLGINVAPLLAGAGIVGLGVSLAAQNLIKDMINGLLILIEDQFTEGDVISVDGKTGAVERMNLRMTQLRNTEGTLITIPNSAITIVENLSNEWARVDLSIEVVQQTDPDQAIAIMQTIAIEMSQDPDWQAKILDPPQVLGVDQIRDSGLTLRIWIRVQPLEQWNVSREYLRRLKHAFDHAGIILSQRAIWIPDGLAGGSEVKSEP